MLYSLFTHDCLSCHVRTKILNFADDTTVIGLITNSDVIDGRTVEIVKHFKFLGSTISSNLTCELNVVNIVKKAQQRLYFLRRLRSVGLTTQVMPNFSEL